VLTAQRILWKLRPNGLDQKQQFSSPLTVVESRFSGSRVTSDGGLILVRELDERLGFSDLIAQHLTDSRGKNTQLPLADLLRQSIYSRIAGYEDVNDAERLAHDPTFRLIGSDKIWERGGHKDDSPFLSSVPLEQSAAGAEPAGLQPGQFVAAAGAAAANRELVAHEFTATTGEAGRTAGETCSLPLALAGGKPSDEAALWE
jgi:hypothetical protein